MGIPAKVHKSKKVRDLASKLLILYKKKGFCDESAQNDVLKNKLPLNSILSKFSELDLTAIKYFHSSVTLTTAVTVCFETEKPEYSNEREDP